LRRVVMNNFPIRVHAELTAVCNLACSMCPRHFIEEKQGYMTWELWKKIVDECAQYENVTLIPFWRGESLLHPEFNRFIQYAHERVASVQITTNGILIGEDNLESLLLMDFISVSIHTKEGLDHAKWLLEQRNRRNASNPVLQISFVEGERTIDKYMMKLIEDKELGGFDRIRLFEKHTEDGVFGASSKQHSQEERTFCNKLNDIIVIDVDGEISRCSYLWNCEEGLNVNNTSIYDIWHGELYQTIRKNYPDKKCAPCDQWGGVTRGKLYQLEAGVVKEYVY
jgi:MoaA/NifB/PqqE/SkfB family radical SAM enzyme